jgi:DHA2 family multidrug resistance protein
MTGWLQRRFGFKRYFAGSILLFILASALCGMSWNLPSLVAFRILQGVGGGAIIPTSQSILFARYPREEHGMAGALFGIGAMTGPLLGPTVGGYLIDIASWHWIFLINVPFGLLAAYLAWRHIDQPGFTPPHEPIDRRGIALLAVGMASLQYVLEEGNREGWFDSLLIMALAATAAVALTTFIAHELETDHPVVDLRAFANRSYTAATGLNFLIGTALFSGGFLFSLYLGTVMRYRALDIGLLFLEGSAIQLALMPMIGKHGSKLDGRKLVVFGLCVLTLSLWLNSTFSLQSDHAALLRPIFVRAIGLCFIFVPLSVIALSDLPLERRGAATGLFNLTRKLGGSIGTAWMSSMLNRTTKIHFTAVTSNVDIWNPLARERIDNIVRGVGTRFIDAEAGAHALLNQTIGLQALVRAFDGAFRTLAILFMFSLCLVLFLKRPGTGVKVEGAH